MSTKKAQGPKPNRAHRVAGLLRAELMELLLRGGLRDKAIADAYVTNVEFTADLRHARVYFRLTRSKFTSTVYLLFIYHTRCAHARR